MQPSHLLLPSSENNVNVDCNGKGGSLEPFEPVPPLTLLFFFFFLIDHRGLKHGDTKGIITAADLVSTGCTRVTAIMREVFPLLRHARVKWSTDSVDYSATVEKCKKGNRSHSTRSNAGAGSIH